MNVAISAKAVYVKYAIKRRQKPATKTKNELRMIHSILWQHNFLASPKKTRHSFRFQIDVVYIRKYSIICKKNPQIN